MGNDMKIKLDNELKGEILDIGGGGEGVIGQIYQQQVIAIDNNQEELDEAPDVCRKMLMDATSLCFKEGEFDHVTAFYSLMYMTGEEQRKAINEMFRVLKYGGTLHIWDTIIRCAYPEPFIVSLDIDANGTSIHTTYGIVKTDLQDMELFINMCQEAGMTLVRKTMDKEQFYLQFCKTV